MFLGKTMAVSIEIITIPIGSQLVSAIGTDDLDDQNDFTALILLDANGTGLTGSAITFSTGASLVELTGNGVTWKATIRPPVTAGMLTITIGADAFTEGNAETSKDIRVSTAFPDDDAEAPSELFTVSYEADGITLTPTRILVGDQAGSSLTTLRRYLHDGTAMTGETSTVATRGFSREIDIINGDILIGQPFRLGVPAGISSMEFRLNSSQNPNL